MRIYLGRLPNLCGYSRIRADDRRFQDVEGCKNQYVLGSIRCRQVLLQSLRHRCQTLPLSQCGSAYTGIRFCICVKC